MESEGLKQFLKVVGDAVYSLNTICVGLEGVASGAVTKSEDLTITWTTTDPKRTALSARKFAIRSALIFVEEALSNYISFISICSNQTEKVKNACNTEGAAERVFQLSKQIDGLEDYWVPFVTLLIRWRNKVVHNSSSNLSPLHRKIILGNAVVIKERHASINVEETIENFDRQKITLKDFSTMIAITIRFVRYVDCELKPTFADVEAFKRQLVERGLESVYKRVVGVNGELKQKSKFRAFIDSNFSTIGDSAFEELFEIRFEIANKI